MLDNDVLHVSSLSDMIIVLAEDFDRCHKNVVNAITDARQSNEPMDDQFHARQLIRSLFALVEGVTFAIKMYALAEVEVTGGPISDAERALACEERYQINNQGEAIITSAHIRLKENIRFAFHLFSKVSDTPSNLDVQSEWWNSLVRSIKVRDRLMHPRSPEDLTIYPKETLAAADAERGFREAVYRLIGLDHS
jgi:hypothetical protein